jgi:hypothetical protein
MPKVLLVVEWLVNCSFTKHFNHSFLVNFHSQPRVNWYNFFADAKLHGSELIEVEQATWSEIRSIHVEHQGGALVDIAAAAKPHRGTSQERSRTVRPDFVLMRSVSRSGRFPVLFA